MLIAVPRISCGYLLTADVGAQKFGLSWSPPENNPGFFEVAYWFPNDVAEVGGIFAQFPGILAWMAAFSEADGGVFLLLGLFSRPFAVLLIPPMLVAICYQQVGRNRLDSTGFVLHPAGVRANGGLRCSGPPRSNWHLKRRRKGQRLTVELAGGRNDRSRRFLAHHLPNHVHLPHRLPVYYGEFVVNGEFELPDDDNRVMVFVPEGDTTLYRATYNVRAE